MCVLILSGCKGKEIIEADRIAAEQMNVNILKHNEPGGKDDLSVKGKPIIEINDDSIIVSGELENTLLLTVISFTIEIDYMGSYKNIVVTERVFVKEVMKPYDLYPFEVIHALDSDIKGIRVTVTSIKFK